MIKDYIKDFIKAIMAIVVGIIFTCAAGWVTGSQLVRQNNEAKNKEIESNLIEKVMESNDSLYIVKRLKFYADLGLFTEETKKRISTNMVFNNLSTVSGSSIRARSLIVSDTLSIETPFIDNISGISVVVNTIYQKDSHLWAYIKIHRPKYTVDEYKDMELILPHKLYYEKTPYIFVLQSNNNRTDSYIAEIYDESKN